tara:strand:- start:659 stop:3790 length:3132 start_codon:yes stop_codon:yes gene_type:complete
MKLISKGIVFLASYFIFTGIAMSYDQPRKLNNIKKVALADIIKRIDSKYKKLDEIQQSSPIVLPDYTTSNVLKKTESLQESRVVGSSDESLADGGEDAFTGIPESEELIMSVFVDKLYLADVFGYKSKNGAKISLQNLFEILDFPISIDMTARHANGWFIREEQVFEFDFFNDNSLNSSASVVINGDVYSVPADDFFIRDNQIYVEGSILSKWFSLNVTYDFSDLRLDFSPAEPLPVQLRLARENKVITSKRTNLPAMPWKESSYQMLSSPMLDAQILHSTSNRENSDFTHYSILGSHDLAYMNTEYFVAGRLQGGLSDARLKFSKEIEQGIFGFLPEGYIEIGDINNVSINSEFKGGLNRGLVFSKKLREVKNNQIININGDIQPGWDIELYQNNILIAKQTSVQSGRYEFNNIDLIFGNNNFEIISYGPQGQVKREFKDVFIDSNALAEFEDDYAFSITQVGKSLLGVNDELTSLEEGILFAGTYGLGITDWLSLSVGQSSLLNDNGENEYSYSVGSSLNLYKRMLINANIDINQDSDISSYFTARTMWLGQSFFYSYDNQEYQNTDIFGTSEKISDIKQTLRMSGALLQAEKYRMNYNNLFYLRNNLDGSETTRLQNQISLSAGRFSIQHSLDWQSISEQNFSDESLNGFVQMQRNLGPIFSRLSLGYSLHPESKLDYVTTQFSWAILDNIQTDLELNYVPETDAYKGEVGVNWQNDNFSLSSNFSYNDDDEWTLGLFLRFAFGYDIDQKSSFVDPFALARNGAMAVRVFEDINNDGLYQDEEPTIEGAKINATQSQRQANTGTDGIAYLTNLRNRVKTDIEIDKGTLGDPFLIPSSPGVSITPRKGFLEKIDYPVVTSSEIDGTIYVVDINGNERNLGYVPINLLNEKGETVAKTQSEYDGYYLFVDLIPGKYFVSVSTEYLKKHKLENANHLVINLTVQGDIINGSDFVLSELEFTNGFVVKAGEFNNLSMLKVYWHLIQKRYRDKLKQRAFYVVNENSGQYQLNLGFYQDKSNGIQACDTVSAINIECSVENFEFVP